MNKFRAHTVGSADFANGTAYRIDQIKASGACQVVDLATNKVTNYTSSIPAAWRSVKFMARVHPKTNRTTDGRT